jgi:hypothetical protein
MHLCVQRFPWWVELSYLSWGRFCRPVDPLDHRIGSDRHPLEAGENYSTFLLMHVHVAKSHPGVKSNGCMAKACICAANSDVRDFLHSEESWVS